MELTLKQQEGLKVAVNRYRHHDRYTVISGYAGTGKSTLVRFIIDALDMEEDRVVFAAFTGKAANVLRQKGNKNAMTLHKLLYESIPRRDGGFYRKPKTELDYDIVIVDEVSMVPKSMVDLLLSHKKTYVIFLGDPFQLPQIDSKDAHTLLDYPHIFLDEVMRQAQESEIIRLTMAIRDFTPLTPSNGTEVKVIPPIDTNSKEGEEMLNGICVWADQILTATNMQKGLLNQRVRGIYGRDGMPTDGDKVICLRNSWDDLSDDGETPLVNGLTGIIQAPYDSYFTVPPNVRVPGNRVNIIKARFIVDGEDTIFSTVNMDRQTFETGEYSLSSRQRYDLGKLKFTKGDLIPKEFTFGYAVTTWKAQGSEWQKVFGVEESFPYKKEDHYKFLYTTATRATEKLVFMLKE